LDDFKDFASGLENQARESADAYAVLTEEKNDLEAELLSVRHERKSLADQLNHVTREKNAFQDDVASLKDRLESALAAVAQRDDALASLSRPDADTSFVSVASLSSRVSPGKDSVMAQLQSFAQSKSTALDDRIAQLDFLATEFPQMSVSRNNLTVQQADMIKEPGLIRTWSTASMHRSQHLLQQLKSIQQSLIVRPTGTSFVHRCPF
jgi:chromosome segregation ATPase